MAFDQNTRGRLQKLVNACRALLSEDFSIQLQQVYGLNPKTGEVTPMARLTHLDDRQRHTAEVLRRVLDHYLGSDADDQENRIAVIDRMVREQAFTVLNRMAALLMMEARGQLFESVSKGYQSRGFQSYARLAGTALGETGQAYQAYLFSLFDELAQELQGLFDRFAANGLLFPRETALRALLDELNHADITPLWGEDETIGWIYQYFNSKEERKAMRDASQAPRNSRELAVRNQFFTPRYVVEFLVDNTLGRLWYQATKGTTKLKDRCQYLLCTPRDVFLRRFDADDLRTGSVAALVQAGKWSELPAFDTSEAGVQAMIEFAHCVNTYDRQTKDTFGGYFQRIEPVLQAQRFGELSTQEIWDGVFLICRADRHGGDGGVYRQSWFFGACQAILDRLKTDDAQQKVNVISHHAVRDPRTLKLLDPACGSMHFGLYAFDLFAEIYREAWAWEQQHGPGSLDVSTQAQDSLKPLCQTYADEDAFLRDVPHLIIEHNIYGVDIDPRAAQIASLALWLRAQRAWNDAGVKAKDRPLVGRGHVIAAIAPPVEQELRQQFAANLDPRDAELFEKTLHLLKGLPELGVLLQVERELPSLIRQVFVGKGTGLFAHEERADWLGAEARLRKALIDFAQAVKSTYQGRLFAQDALQGLRLIDLCREVFDVVVMNPPFGLPAAATKAHLTNAYPDTWKDIYAAFIERALQLLNSRGMLGAITPSMWQYSRQLRDLRQSLINLGSPRLLVEVGNGVMDDAAVEASIWTASKNRHADDLWSLDLLKHPRENRAVLMRDRGASWTKHLAEDFTRVAEAPYCHHVPKNMLSLWKRTGRLEQVARIAKGNTTFDDFRFLRLWYEAPAGSIDRWRPYRSGGDFQPFFAASRLRIDWKNDGASVRAWGTGKHGSDAQVMQSSDLWFRAGLGYPRVGTLGFGVRVAPAGEIFSGSSVFVLPQDPAMNLPLLALLNSSTALALFEAHGRHRRTETIALKDLPITWDDLVPISGELEQLAATAVCAIRSWEATDETNPLFLRPFFDGSNFESNIFSGDIYCQVTGSARKASKIIAEKMGVSVEDLPSIDAENWNPTISLDESAARLFSYIVGVTYYRWNPCAASGKLPIESSNLFDPLPLIPPGAMTASARSESTMCAKDTNRHEILQRDFGIIDHERGQPSNFASRVRSALVEIFSCKADDIENKLCKALSINDLENYIERPSGFFSDHLKKYTSNRRNAPIYWPLSTSSVGYTLWLYYPSLTSQTLYTAINDFVEPKLVDVANKVATLRAKASARSRDEEKRLESLISLEAELIDLRDQLQAIAPKYRPNHDDGVQITAAPLWPLFRHKPWQKLLKETWAKLQKGDYDWAHLAMNYWPDRVREKCKTDKSLAIAHGLEQLYIEPDAAPKKTRGKKKKEDAE